LQFKQPRCIQSSANTETQDCSDQGQQQQAKSLSSKGCRHAVSAIGLRDTSVKQHKASADRINVRGCWCCARASTIRISLATPKLSRFFRNFAAAVDMLNVPMPPLVGQQPGLLDWRCVEVNANFLEVKISRRSF
jgi:hypothetical protein